MIHFESAPELEKPILICAFRGWTDGGQSAGSALEYLRDLWKAEKFGSIDPEDFYDFQINRPIVHLVDGTNRQIDWPVNDLYFARPEGRDVVLLLGTEPNLKWRTFSSAVVDGARAMGVEQFISLGAFLADIPHSRVPPVTGVSRDRSLTERLGLFPAQYEGPTGIISVLYSAMTDAGFDTVSLWAAVPHYLGIGPNPRGARVLLTKLESVTDLVIDTSMIEQSERNWEERVNEIIASDPDLAEHVKRLEEAYPTDADIRPMPTGDDLARELEEFLKDL